MNGQTLLAAAEFLFPNETEAQDQFQADALAGLVNETAVCELARMSERAQQMADKICAAISIEEELDRR